MKFVGPLGSACVIVATASGCVATADLPPLLALPAVTSIAERDDRPTAAPSLDAVPPQYSATAFDTVSASEEEPAQRLAAIHITAPALQGVREAESSASAPSTAGSMRSYRFGQSEPVLMCTVLRACVIELETAEALVDDPIAGDQARWIITTAKTGRGGVSLLVIVKPKACDVSTNLVLSTDRRIYDVDLDSPPCSAHDTNPKRAYTRHIRFTYPNEADSFAVAPASAPVRAVPITSERRDSSSATGAISTDSLNRNYRVVTETRGPFRLFGRKRSTFPWRPSAISDDGTHVYVSLPKMSRKYASPVLYALEDDGSRTIVNYVVRDTVIVTDRVFRRGVLVIPSGKREETLVFENRVWSAASRVRP